jgi:hypothetical protein
MAQLQDITILSPSVLGTSISTEAEFLTLTLSCDIDADRLNIKFNNVSSILVSGVIVGPNRVFDVPLVLPTIEGSYSLIVQAINTTTGDQSAFKILDIVVAKNLDGIRCLPPSGVSVSRRKNTCKISWVTPDYPGFLGVRVAKADSDIGPFITIGNLVTRVTSVVKDIINSEVSVVDNISSVITTTVDLISNTSKSEIEIQRLTTDTDTFYVVLSTLVQDPDSKHIFESQYNGPIKCGYVDLKKVSPQDFLALQNQEDIATRMISQINTTNPDLDLSPRSEIRDLMIDPLSAELSNASIRVWFDQISRSISALAQIDDMDNDGVSDPVASSDVKQSIANAFSLPIDSVQPYIDSQFDIFADSKGTPRLAATTAIGSVKIYSVYKPTQRVEILVNGLVATVKDEQTPSVNFILRGSAVIDPSNADALYNQAKNRWEVSIPIECDSAGSIGNVGAGTIRRVISGVPSGWQVINDEATDFGWDQETNSNLAARIMDRMIVGVDSGTKMGLKSVSKAIPGILDVKIVGANDQEMLRDWDPIRDKHIYGSVDVYVKGITKSEIVNKTPFGFGNSTSVSGLFSSYVAMTRDSLGDGILPIRYRISNPEHYANKALAIVELYMDKGSSSSFYLDVSNSTVDENGVFSIDPMGTPFKMVGGEPQNMSGTNYGVLSSNTGAIARGFLRFKTGVDHTPATQPVYSVSSISGETGKIGVIDSRKYRVVKSSDPLLSGNSDASSDRIVVDQTLVPDYKVLQFVSDNESKLVDTGIFLTNEDFLIVKDSADPSIKYVKGTHYNIVPSGRYNTYNIVRLTGATTPIPLNTDFVVGYNRLNLRESITKVTETHTVSLNPVYFDNNGFIDNIWLPETYKLTDLITDVNLVSIPRAKRYIKVMYDNGSGAVAMREGTDFAIQTFADGSCSIYRLAGIGSSLPENSIVTITFYRIEMLDIRYLYPAYVTMLKNKIEDMRHAGSDVVVKDMMDTKVDLSISVEVDSYSNVGNIDSKIRTAISIAMDNAKDRLTQAELVKQIKNISGVTNITLPFTKFTKSDGAYEVGTVIPAGTSWLNAKATNPSLPANAWITEFPVLPTLTIPSGGRQDAFVGLLYGGELMTRVLSIGALTGKIGTESTGWFYIIGVGDIDPYNAAGSGRIIFIPPTKIVDPANKAYKVTYQVFNEIGSKDISMSSTEYLRPGTLVLDYKTR